MEKSVKSNVSVKNISWAGKIKPIIYVYLPQNRTWAENEKNENEKKRRI